MTEQCWASIASVIWFWDSVSSISSELTWKTDVRRMWWSQSLSYQRCTRTSQHAGSTCRAFPSAFWGCWGCSLEDLGKQQRGATCGDNSQGVSWRKWEEWLHSWLLTLNIFCKSDTVDKYCTGISCLNLQIVCMSILILKQKGEIRNWPKIVSRLIQQ